MTGTSPYGTSGSTYSSSYGSKSQPEDTAKSLAQLAGYMGSMLAMTLTAVGAAYGTAKSAAGIFAMGRSAWRLGRGDGDERVF